MNQRIGFCTAADGTRIAYAVVGEGPVLVKAPNWLTHLEFEWQSPVWRHWWVELAKHHQVIRFDQRGSGLSDWNVEDTSFASWVSDMEAVVDCIGIDQFAVLGISQGGAVAIEYTAHHPEKVSRLILYGAYSRGRMMRGGSLEEFEAQITLTRHGWGRNNPAYRQMFTSQFMPEATAEQMNWFNELQRVSTSPEIAATILRELGYIDVMHLLPKIEAPTLVLHARDEERVPFEQGRQIAALIPNSKLIAREGRNHLLIESEPAWQVALAEVRKFLGVPHDASLSSVPAQGTTGELIKPGYPDGLTVRELEVLRLVASGKSNPQIAQELFISAKTVGNHVSNILNKTNTANRTEAAAYAVRHGIE